MQKKVVLYCSKIFTLTVLNISSLLNLVADTLRRTCTGTINIDLQGSGWVENGKVTDSTSTGSSGGTAGGSAGTGTVGPAVTSTSVKGGDTDTNTDDKSSTGTPGTQPMVNGLNPSDNVHFGPAGIGLLIMGFLVLGCKYF